MHAAFAKRGAPLALLLALGSFSCTAEEIPASTIVLAMSTDMEVPKEVKSAGLYIQHLDGDSVLDQWSFQAKAEVDADGRNIVPLPGTFTVQGNDGRERVRARIVAFDEAAQPIIMREVRTAIPSRQARLVRMPLLWVNSGDVADASPDTTDITALDYGVGSFDAFSRFSSIACGPDATLDETGRCTSVLLDVDSLPVYAPEQLPNDLRSDGQCIEANACLSGNGTVPVAVDLLRTLGSECVLTLPYAMQQVDEDGNPLFGLGAQVDGVLRNLGGAARLDADGRTVRIDGRVCTRLRETAQNLVLSARCPSVRADLPACGSGATASNAIVPRDEILPPVDDDDAGTPDAEQPDAGPTKTSFRVPVTVPVDTLAVLDGGTRLMLGMGGGNVSGIDLVRPHMSAVGDRWIQIDGAFFDDRSVPTGIWRIPVGSESYGLKAGLFDVAGTSTLVAMYDGPRLFELVPGAGFRSIALEMNQGDLGYEYPITLVQQGQSLALLTTEGVRRSASLSAPFVLTPSDEGLRPSSLYVAFPVGDGIGFVDSNWTGNGMYTRIVTVDATGSGSSVGLELPDLPPGESDPEILRDGIGDGNGGFYVVAGRWQGEHRLLHYTSTTSGSEPPTWSSVATMDLPARPENLRLQRSGEHLCISYGIYQSDDEGNDSTVSTLRCRHVATGREWAPATTTLAPAYHLSADGQVYWIEENREGGEAGGQLNDITVHRSRLPTE